MTPASQTGCGAGGRSEPIKAYLSAGLVAIKLFVQSNPVDHHNVSLSSSHVDRLLCVGVLDSGHSGECRRQAGRVIDSLKLHHALASSGCKKAAAAGRRRARARSCLLNRIRFTLSS